MDIGVSFLQSNMIHLVLFGSQSWQSVYSNLPKLTKEQTTFPPHLKKPK